MKIFSSVVLSLFALSCSVLLAEQKKPNILFIFADDFAYDCLAAHGNTQVKTPHLDQLSRSGTYFERAYNPGGWGGAVCVCSRTMMMKGQQIWAANQSLEPQMVEQGKLFPQLMQKAGYETYFAGKWHVLANCEKLWKNTRHVRGGMPRQSEARVKRTFEPGLETADWSPADPKHGGFWQGGKHWSEVLADDGELFIQEAAKQEKPFMMMLCFNAPHDPRQAPQAYQDMYPYASIDLPRPFKEQYDYDIGVNTIRDEKLAPFPRTKHAIQVNRSEYYALISHMDAQIGRVLDRLEQSGLADNTIIIFSADHGISVGHHGFVGKQNVYEHSMRVPWIIAGPGVPAGKKIKEPIYLQDAMATCLDLAGVEKPAHIDFNSVLPALEKGRGPMPTVYGAYAHTQRMVIHNGYKLIVYPAIQQKRLYHLDVDPDETLDLIANPEYASRVVDLEKRLVEQMKNWGDPIDLDDYSPDRFMQQYHYKPRHARIRAYEKTAKKRLRGR